ncbi:uncharacterized protein LOC124698388 [Lolium rigidum]|uniref:uncharacterized protein LOC124698388 n=1 Tax=Lolium rigidum TaxID=89674 RepID=UPI001F5DC697|nr:uncharacterized protein LOC124698388 [Lolium rigidum]
MSELLEAQHQDRSRIGLTRRSCATNTFYLSRHCNLSDLAGWSDSRRRLRRTSTIPGISALLVLNISTPHSRSSPRQYDEEDGPNSAFDSCEVEEPWGCTWESGSDQSQM